MEKLLDMGGDFVILSFLPRDWSPETTIKGGDVIRTIINILASVRQGLVQYYVSVAVRQYQEIAESTAQADLDREGIKILLDDLFKEQSKYWDANQAKVIAALDSMDAFDKVMEARLAKQKALDEVLGI